MARRLFYKSENFNIVEFTPAPRMIAIDIKRKDIFEENIHRKFYLSLPYMQLAQLQKENGEIFFFASCTKTPLKTLDDAVGVPLLPNIHSDLSVLLPDAPHPDIQVNIESFFSSYFTDRDAYEWPGINGVKKLFGSFEEWENQTKINPKFILDKPLLRPMNPTIDGMPYQRSIRFSDIPKIENFLVNNAVKNGEDLPDDPDPDPVQILLNQMEQEQKVENKPVPISIEEFKNILIKFKGNP